MKGYPVGDMMNINALEKIALSVRTLSMDAIQKAKSGHPGLPLGCAEIGAYLYGEAMRYNTADLNWINRDRFVLSAGHGSMLLYSLLHLAGFDITIEDIQNFRQFGSKTPGHPEYGITPGVEVTTGPLGQGIANAVGMAAAEKILANKFNRPKQKIIDHYTYVLAGEGDLMEGVSAEAASFAGHQNLGKLIVFFDYNKITIEGSTDLAFTEDVLQRFASYGWQTLQGNPYDLNELDSLTAEAKNQPDRPSIILLKTTIAKGACNLAGSHKTHGAPLGEKEIKASKSAFGVAEDDMFYVDPQAVSYFEEKKGQLSDAHQQWQDMFAAWKDENQDLYQEWQNYFNPEQLSLEKLDEIQFNIGDSVPTRKASGIVLNTMADIVPNIIGGSADLASSNNTFLTDKGSFQTDTPSGRNFHFGVREHAMGAIVNGLYLHGGLRPYCATFLVFVDYMRPPIRLAALMKLPVIYVFSHDSIFVGEDGPTHQPVEHLASLRIIPGLTVLRPADAQEMVLAWKMAFLSQDSPTAIILTRQGIEVFAKSDQNWQDNINKGAYIANDSAGDPETVFVATGSEVSLAIKVKEKLGDQNIRVISMISKELFLAQNNGYKEQLIPAKSKKVVMEAGVRQGWEGIAGDNGQIISIDSFGESGPAAQLADHFGLTVDKVISQIS